MYTQKEIEDYERSVLIRTAPRQRMSLRLESFILFFESLKNVQYDEPFLTKIWNNCSDMFASSQEQEIKMSFQILYNICDTQYDHLGELLHRFHSDIKNHKGHTSWIIEAYKKITHNYHNAMFCIEDIIQFYLSILNQSRYHKMIVKTLILIFSKNNSYLTFSQINQIMNINEQITVSNCQNGSILNRELLYTNYALLEQYFSFVNSSNTHVLINVLPTICELFTFMSQTILDLIKHIRHADVLLRFTVFLRKEILRRETRLPTSLFSPTYVFRPTLETKQSAIYLFSYMCWSHLFPYPVMYGDRFVLLFIQLLSQNKHPRVIEELVCSMTFLCKYIDKEKSSIWRFIYLFLDAIYIYMLQYEQFFLNEKSLTANSSTKLIQHFRCYFSNYIDYYQGVYMYKNYKDTFEQLETEASRSIASQFEETIQYLNTLSNLQQLANKMNEKSSFPITTPPSKEFPLEKKGTYNENSIVNTTSLFEVIEETMCLTIPPALKEYLQIPFTDSQITSHSLSMNIDRLDDLIGAGISDYYIEKATMNHVSPINLAHSPLLTVSSMFNSLKDVSELPSDQQPLQQAELQYCSENQIYTQSIFNMLFYRYSILQELYSPVIMTNALEHIANHRSKIDAYFKSNLENHLKEDYLSDSDLGDPSFTTSDPDSFNNTQYFANHYSIHNKYDYIYLHDPFSCISFVQDDLHFFKIKSEMINIISVIQQHILKDDYDGSIDEFFFLFTSFIEYTNYKFLEATTTFFCHHYDFTQSKGQFFLELYIESLYRLHNFSSFISSVLIIFHQLETLPKEIFCYLYPYCISSLFSFKIFVNETNKPQPPSNENSGVPTNSNNMSYYLENNSNGIYYIYQYKEEIINYFKTNNPEEIFASFVEDVYTSFQLLDITSMNLVLHMFSSIIIVNITDEISHLLISLYFHLFMKGLVKDEYIPSLLFIHIMKIYEAFPIPIIRESILEFVMSVRVTNTGQIFYRDEHRTIHSHNMFVHRGMIPATITTYQYLPLNDYFFIILDGLLFEDNIDYFNMSILNLKDSILHFSAYVSINYNLFSKKLCEYISSNKIGMRIMETYTQLYHQPMSDTQQMSIHSKGYLLLIYATQYYNIYNNDTCISIFNTLTYILDDIVYWCVNESSKTKPEDQDLIFTKDFSQQQLCLILASLYHSLLICIYSLTDVNTFLFEGGELSRRIQLVVTLMCTLLSIRGTILDHILSISIQFLSSMLTVITRGPVLAAYDALTALLYTIMNLFKNALNCVDINAEQSLDSILLVTLLRTIIGEYEYLKKRKLLADYNILNATEYCHLLPKDYALYRPRTTQLIYQIDQLLFQLRSVLQQRYLYGHCVVSLLAGEILRGGIRVEEPSLSLKDLQSKAIYTEHYSFPSYVLSIYHLNLFDTFVYVRTPFHSNGYWIQSANHSLSASFPLATAEENNRGIFDPSIPYVDPSKVLDRHREEGEQSEPLKSSSLGASNSVVEITPLPPSVAPSPPSSPPSSTTSPSTAPVNKFSSLSIDTSFMQDLSPLLSFSKQTTPMPSSGLEPETLSSLASPSHSTPHSDTTPTSTGSTLQPSFSMNASYQNLAISITTPVYKSRSKSIVNPKITRTLSLSNTFKTPGSRLHVSSPLSSTRYYSQRRTQHYSIDRTYDSPMMSTPMSQPPTSIPKTRSVESFSNLLSGSSMSAPQGYSSAQTKGSCLKSSVSELDLRHMSSVQSNYKSFLGKIEVSSPIHSDLEESLLQEGGTSRLGEGNQTHDKSPESEIRPPSFGSEHSPYPYPHHHFPSNDYSQSSSSVPNPLTPTDECLSPIPAKIKNWTANESSNQRRRKPIRSFSVTSYKPSSVCSVETPSNSEESPEDTRRHPSSLFASEDSRPISSPLHEHEPVSQEDEHVIDSICIHNNTQPCIICNHMHYNPNSSINATTSMQLLHSHSVLPSSPVSHSWPSHPNSIDYTQQECTTSSLSPLPGPSMVPTVSNMEHVSLKQEHETLPSMEFQTAIMQTPCDSGNEFGDQSEDDVENEEQARPLNYNNINHNHAFMHPVLLNAHTKKKESGISPQTPLSSNTNDSTCRESSSLPCLYTLNPSISEKDSQFYTMIYDKTEIDKQMHSKGKSNATPEESFYHDNHDSLSTIHSMASPVLSSKPGPALACSSCSSLCQVSNSPTHRNEGENSLSLISCPSIQTTEFLSNDSEYQEERLQENESISVPSLSISFSSSPYSQENDESMKSLVYNKNEHFTSLFSSESEKQSEGVLLYATQQSPPSSLLQQEETISSSLPTEQAPSHLEKEDVDYYTRCYNRLTKQVMAKTKLNIKNQEIYNDYSETMKDRQVSLTETGSGIRSRNIVIPLNGKSEPQVSQSKPDDYINLLQLNDVHSILSNSISSVTQTPRPMSRSQLSSPYYDNDHNDTEENKDYHLSKKITSANELYQNYNEYKRAAQSSQIDDRSEIEALRQCQTNAGYEEKQFYSDIPFSLTTLLKQDNLLISDDNYQGSLFIPNNQLTEEFLNELDHCLDMSVYKVAILYTTEAINGKQVLTNLEMSPAFETFLLQMGQFVRLKDLDSSQIYVAGLDTHQDHDGEYLLHFTDQYQQIAFHVPTLMKQRVEDKYVSIPSDQKLRFTGNDLINIIFYENMESTFDYSQYTSSLTCIFILVTPLSPDFYDVYVKCTIDIPLFIPITPGHHIYYKDTFLFLLRQTIYTASYCSRYKLRNKVPYASDWIDRFVQIRNIYEYYSKNNVNATLNQ